MTANDGGKRWSISYSSLWRILGIGTSLSAGAGRARNGLSYRRYLRSLACCSLSLSLALSSLSGIYTPRSALAEEGIELAGDIEQVETEYLEVDVTSIPSEYESKMLSRTDNEYVAIKSGSAVLMAETPSDGDGDGGLADVAKDVFSNLLNNSISGGQANYELMMDLAWRYYNAEPSMRDKVPVEPLGNARPLSDFDSWGDWYIYTKSNGMLFYYPYRLVGYNDNKSWESSSPNAELEYEQWYNYYNGIDDSGGGGDLVPDTEYLTQSYTLTGIAGAIAPSNTTYDKLNVVGSTFTETIQNLDRLNSYAQQNELKYTIAIATNQRGFTGVNTNAMTCRVFLSKEPINYAYEIIGNENYYNNEYEIYRLTITSNSNLYRIAGNFTASGRDTLTITGGNITSTTLTNLNTNQYIIEDNTEYSRTRLNAIWVSRVNVAPEPQSEPVYPTYPQPTAPEQPAPPTNDSPTTYAPVTNTTNNTTNNTYNTTNTTHNVNTTGATVDLQPILDALNVINVNIQQELEQLEDVNLNIGQVNANLGVINANLDELDTHLVGYTNWAASAFKKLYDMLYGWFGVVSDQIDDWGNEFWDQLRTANGWLEGIFYKLGAGGSSEPDMSIKPKDWWEWLGDILGNLLGDLPAALSELTGAFQGLRNLFPFSIPWDLAVILAMFVSEPVTPVFDVPIPFAADGVAYVHVDLSAWDGVMVAVRSVELATFAAGLALRTREMLKNLEVSQ